MFKIIYAENDFIGTFIHSGGGGENVIFFK